jgi:hypothetical protein
VAGVQVSHTLVAVCPFPLGLGAGAVTLGDRCRELAAGYADCVLKDGGGGAGQVELFSDSGGLDLGALGALVGGRGSGNGASGPFLGFRPG